MSASPNERALLGCLLAKLAAIDADVLVGHNIGAYELVVLLGRLQKHKVIQEQLLAPRVPLCVHRPPKQMADQEAGSFWLSWWRSPLGCGRLA